MGSFIGNIDSNYLEKIIPSIWRPSALMHSCRRSLKFLITFVNIIAEIAAIPRCMVSFNSGIVRRLPWYTLDFRYHRKKKSQELRSGERGDHGMTFIETLAVRAVTLSC